MVRSQDDGGVRHQFIFGQGLDFAARRSGSIDEPVRAHRPSHFLRSCCWSYCFMIHALFLSAYPANSVKAQGNELDSVLSTWIEDDLHFLFDSSNRPKLAIRRKPIRAYIRSEDQSAGDQMMVAVNSFSQAAGVSIEFTSLDPNLIAVVTTPINEGRKPKKALLMQLGLPESAADSLIANSDWSTGCGLYAYGDLQGEIALTLMVADKNLSAGDLKDCVTDGIIRAFGFRTKRTSTVRSVDGYLQYLIMAKALRRCDGEVRERPSDVASLRSTYTQCSKEIIKRMMTLPDGHR